MPEIEAGRSWTRQQANSVIIGEYHSLIRTTLSPALQISLKTHQNPQGIQVTAVFGIINITWMNTLAKATEEFSAGGHSDRQDLL